MGDRSMRHEHMRSVETAARSAREKSTQRRACALARRTAPCPTVRTSTAPSRAPSRDAPCAVSGARPAAQEPRPAHAPATCLHWACAVGAPCRARCAARSASGSSPCPCAPRHATHGPLRREQTSCETVPVLGARLMAQCCDSPVRMWAGSIAGGGSGMRRGGNQARRAVERHRQLDPRLCARQRQ